MKPLALFPALALLVACEQPTAPASPGLDLQPSFGVTVNVRVPLVGLLVDVECALDGAGETVELQGSLHVILASTEDEAGGNHNLLHYQPSEVSGVGLTSGDTYRGVGLTRETVNVSDLPFNDTYVNNFYIIGVGTGAKAKVHETYHVTVSATGEVATELENSWATCE